MEFNVKKIALAEIQYLRILFLHEGNFQFICNKCHDYGWADTYVFRLNDQIIGYGSVWGTERREDRDTIFEFYILKPFRVFSSLVFSKFCEISKTIYIEAQTNDLLLASMLYEYSENISPEAILFEDHYNTCHTIPDAVFRAKIAKDEMGEDDSDYILVFKNEIVASGGLMFNYNMPYADIYMQVKERFLRRGFGSLIVQELKKTAYLMGRIPAARCNINNQISKATLLKSGLKICGSRLKGTIKKLRK